MSTPAQPQHAPEPQDQPQQVDDDVATTGVADASDELDDEATDDGLPPIPVIPPHVNKEIFRAALRATLLLLVGLTVLGVGIGALVAGTAGVWGAVLGVAVALVFSGTTIASVLYTADKAPSTMMAVILGAWVGKMALLLVLLAVIGQMDFYNRVIFGVVVMIGAVGSAMLDMFCVVKGREPYVTPS